MGEFDDDPGIRPQFHTFVDDRAPWDDITDKLPQYREAWSLLVSARCAQRDGSKVGMTLGECEQLPPEEKEHVAICTKCTEIFDRRSLDEVLFHTDHKQRPDIQYFGWEKLD